MKILITGKDRSGYNRNLIINNGLKNTDCEIAEFYFSKKNKSNKIKLRELSDKVDVVYLPVFNHKLAGFVKRNISKPLVFDPLISRVMTKVYDRKSISKYSLSALKNFYLEKYIYKISDLLLIDTEAHRQYFIKKYKIPENKIKILPVGVNSKVFFPLTRDTQTDEFIVGYVGGFIPLHGMHHIINAAKILQNKGENKIKFRFIGSGADFQKSQILIKKLDIQNIELLGWIEQKELNPIVKNFDICLSIFGDSIKTDVVIPNKAYEYMAVKKCVLTKDTPAIRELFIDNVNIVLTENKPEKIAEKIIELKNNHEKVDNIAEKGYELVMNKYSEDHIASMFVNTIKEFLL